MDDLMKCLYNFVREKRMGNLCQDPEYEEAARGMELQIKKVKQALDEKQQVELQLLLEIISAHDSIENEHLFQEALGLARELNALLRTG